MNWNKLRRVFPTACTVVQALLPANHKRQIISSMLVVHFFGTSAKAQTGNWQAVENLQPGRPILVKAQRDYFCILEGANDDQLVCEVHQR
jgi:hypothetical protein